MARPPRKVEYDEQARSELEEILKKRKSSSDIHLRARIIMQCMDGWKIADIAAANMVSQPTVIRWKNRYLANGLSALSDRKRSGRPKEYKEDFAVTILSLIEQDPPVGYSQWDGVLLEQQTGY